MMKITQNIMLMLTLGFATQTHAIANAEESQRCKLQTLTMTTAEDGCTGDYCERRAFVCVPATWWSTTSGFQMPASETKAPLVLAFHGRDKQNQDSEGMTTGLWSIIENAPEAGMFGRNTNLHGAMPSAIVVYFQGLPVNGNWAPDTGTELVKNNPAWRGWQVNIGSNASSNRDIKFVEKFLITPITINNTSFAWQNHINKKEVFAVGHSNGSRFVGALWNHSSTESPIQRSNFKAIAFSAAQAGDFPDQGNGVIGQNLFNEADPVSIFMGMGSKDKTVLYSIQQPSIAKAKNLLGISESAIPTQPFTLASNESLEIFTNTNGLRLATYTHPHFVWRQSSTGEWIQEGHVWPTNLPEPSINQENLIAKFFGLQPL